MKLITHEVDDCLRYTVVLPTDLYTDGVSTIISRLTGGDPTDECAIASNINAYNFWSTEKGVSTYMGINAFVTLHPDGDDDKMGTFLCSYYLSVPVLSAYFLLWCMRFGQGTLSSCSFTHRKGWR